MKKILATLLVVIIAYTANAQTEKSTYLLGGSLQFASTSYTGSGSSSTFNFSPNVGYFFMKNYAVGGQFDLATGGGSTSWALGPYIRGYFTDNKNGKPFAQAGIGFGGASGGGNTSVTFHLRGGYAAFLNKNIALEFAANFQTMKGATVFGLGAGFQIHFAK